MEMRVLKKECTVGAYHFYVAINRQILLEAFEAFPKLWKAIASSSDVKIGEGEVGDISKIAKIFELEDVIATDKPKFVVRILPKMVELAGEKELDIETFIKYCVENEVDDAVIDALFEFAMLGFTGGKSEKKPKVTMSIK